MAHEYQPAAASQIDIFDLAVVITEQQTAAIVGQRQCAQGMIQLIKAEIAAVLQRPDGNRVQAGGGRAVAVGRNGQQQNIVGVLTLVPAVKRHLFALLPYLYRAGAGGDQGKATIGTGLCRQYRAFGITALGHRRIARIAAGEQHKCDAHCHHQQAGGHFYELGLSHRQRETVV